jgi:hypothetical protein
VNGNFRLVKIVRAMADQSPRRVRRSKESQMKPLRWITQKSTKPMMRVRQQQNLQRRNKAELWMAQHLHACEGVMKGAQGETGKASRETSRHPR